MSLVYTEGGLAPARRMAIRTRIDSVLISMRDCQAMLTTDWFRTFAGSTALAFAVSISFGCGSSLFRVKPVAELPALPEVSRSSSAGGVTVRVAPLLSDEEAQDLFEANLPLAGVLPVRMEMAFESGVPVEIKRARFRLRDAQGREWKLLSPKSAVSRILKANEVFAYNPHSRKQFEKEFGAYGIDLKEPLSATDRVRRGFLFFQTPKGEPVASPTGLVLTIERLPQPIELTLGS